MTIKNFKQEKPPKAETFGGLLVRRDRFKIIIYLWQKPFLCEGEISLQKKELFSPVGEGRPSGSYFLYGTESRQRGRIRGWLFTKPPPSYVSPPFAEKSLHLQGVPCYDRENTNFKGALLSIRCDAVTAE
jgi:hypothetical protein